MASDIALQLLTAAERGDNATMEELLNQSVSPEVQNASHFTPLILSAYVGNIAGIKLLVAKGANVNAATLSGNTAVMMAAQNGKTDTVEYLSSVMNAGVNTIRNKTGDTPLMFASKNGHLETVKLLLKLGAKSDAANSSGMTAIFCAASGGHVDVIKELIATCSNSKLLQSQDSNGNTPLHFAAYGGHTKTVELLLEQGASPFIRNRHDKTPLMDVTEALPNFTDPHLIQNVTACRSMLVQKCKELEELSQKHMDDLTKLDNPEPPKKQPAKQKTKHKKTKSANNPPQDKDDHTKESELKHHQPKKEQKPKKELPNKESPPDSEPPKGEGKSKPNKEIEDSEQLPTSMPLTITQTKTLPVDIPNNHTGKSPTTGKSPVELYSTIVKSTPPSTSTTPTTTKLTTTSTNEKSQTMQTKLPPGLNALASKPTNAIHTPITTKTAPMPTPITKETASTSVPPTNLPKNTQSPTFTRTITSPSKYHPTSTADTTLLDQALSCINSLDPTQSLGHALEVSYRDYNDMCTAMTTIHPNAAALDLPVKAIVGIGLSELSMEQLGVLEEMHHKMLQAITDAKLEMVRSQERMRLEEQKQLEIALLTNKLRSVE